MSNPASPDFSELLRRAQLQRQLAPINSPATGLPAQLGLPTQYASGLGAPPPAAPANAPQAPLNAPVAAPSVAPPQAPQHPAQSAYQDFVANNEAPKLSDYHPSLGRRIAGVALGALAGMHDPKSGVETGQRVAYGPYSQQLSSYEQRLKEKKDAYELEQNQEYNTARTGAETARTNAEIARSEAEKAAKDVSLGKLSPEAFRQKMEEMAVQYGWHYSQTPKGELGEDVLAHLPGQDDPVAFIKLKNGMFYNPATDTYVGPNALDLKKPVTPLITKEPTEKTVKPTNEEEDLARYAKSLGVVNDKGEGDPSKLSYDQSRKYQQNLAQDKQTPQLAQQRTAGAAHTLDAGPQASYNKNSGILEKHLDSANSTIEVFNNLKATLDQKNPQSDAVAFPQLIKAVVGGLGSGFRMTNAEIMNAVGGRTEWEKLQATINKFSTDPSHPQIPDPQRKQIYALADALEKKIQARRDLALKTLDKLGGSNDINEHRKIMSDYQKRVADIDDGIVEGGGKSSNDLPGGITLDEVNAELERRKKKQ
jgi:hypothetical protein